jgi:hypothetical protein
LLFTVIVPVNGIWSPWVQLCATLDVILVTETSLAVQLRAFVSPVAAVHRSWMQPSDTVWLLHVWARTPLGQARRHPNAMSVNSSADRF